MNTIKSANNKNFIFYIILLIALIIGIVFRLYFYLLNRSLWLDPAFLAVNIVNKDYLSLWGKLDFAQSAPIGFLLSSKFIASFFSYSELSLILLPLIFNISSVFIYLLFCLDVFKIKFVPIAFIPFAFCSTAIYYAGEFKQYSSDLFFSTVILYVSHRILIKNFSKVWIYNFLIVGLLSVYFSHTAIIMLLGTGIALLLNIVKNKHVSKKNGYLLFISETIVLTNFAALYFLQIRNVTVNLLFELWKDSFALLWPISAKTFFWWHNIITGYPRFPLGFHRYSLYITLAAFLISLCVIFLDRSRRPLYTLLIFPLLIVILLSSTHNYPITAGNYIIRSRFVLFTVPIAFILITIGIESISKLIPQYKNYIIFVLSFVLVASSVYESTNTFFISKNYKNEEMRLLVNDLGKQITANDSVFVYDTAKPTFLYYTRNKQIPFYSGTIFSEGYKKSDRAIVNELKDIITNMKSKRLWVVMAHDYVGNCDLIYDVLKYYGPVSVKEYQQAWLFCLILP